DEEIIEAGLNYFPTFAALWRGDTTAEDGDHSVSDFRLCLILCSLTNNDLDQVDRIFCRSGLMREKWDESRGDSTYGAYTISKAADAMREPFRGAGAATRGTVAPSTGRKGNTGGGEQVGETDPAPSSTRIAPMRIDWGYDE